MDNPCIGCEDRWEYWHGWARDACDDFCKKYRKYHKQEHGCYPSLLRNGQI